MSKEAAGSVKEGQGIEEEVEPEEILERERKKNEALLTKLRYLQADFENYRKRTEKEIKDVEEFAVRSLVLRLLNVLDELELAIQNAEKSSPKREVVEGLRMVYKNLNATLEAEGLKSIEAVGKPFDPKLHEAVEKVQGKSREDVVVNEIRRGFAFRNQVIRPTLAKVELAAKTTERQEAKTNE